MVFVDRFRDWILQLGVTGIVLFVVLYVAVTLVIGPASALTLSAGLAYGVWGFPLVVGSATLAAAVAFLIGRYLARERVTRWINRDARLRVLNETVTAQGWRVVGLMRLSPLIPFSVQNYLFSVTQIPFVPYLLATLIGVMPVTALYVYIGSLGHAVGRGGVLQWVLVIGGLLATLAVALFVGRRAQAALANRVIED
jgi:uncharacterized membrane protein YdjX (TVP38/TMEM64 family)